MIVPRGQVRVCIEAMEPDRELRIVAPVGRELPIYAGSSGRIFMMQKTEKQIDGILTDNKSLFVSKEEYLQQLQQVKHLGYAHNVGEVTQDTSAISAPVFDALGNTAAAVVLRAPGTRIRIDMVDELAALVKSAATSISEELGNIHQ